MSPRLRLVVLSEDTGKDGAETVKVLVRKLLAHLHGARALHEDRHWSLPVRPSAFAAGASLWKAKRLTKRLDEDARRQFIKELTEALLSAVIEGAMVNDFVFFHHDGDASWSTHEQQQRDCAQCASFADFVALEIEPSVRWQVRWQLKSQKIVGDEDALVRRAISRLIPVQPHWSIEAWLYGGSDAARELCEARHRAEHCGDDAFWSVSREDLEARAYPKKHCCLTDEFNLELAQRFRAASAVEESPSFGALAEKVRACGDLMSALDAMT